MGCGSSNLSFPCRDVAPARSLMSNPKGESSACRRQRPIDDEALDTLRNRRTLPSVAVEKCVRLAVLHDSGDLKEARLEGLLRFVLPRPALGGIERSEFGLWRAFLGIPAATWLES